MAKIVPIPLALQEALRRLGNPYAKLQMLDEDLEHAGALDHPPRTATERAYFHRQGNPYAILSAEKGAEEVVAAVSTGASAAASKTTAVPTVSQRAFDSECRRIFRQYIPSVEKGRIRPHHRAFIERNQTRPAPVRAVLLEGLRRYDLSRISGLQAQFNREREQLTEDKLFKIELAAIGDNT